ncbi:protein kinase [Lysobacter capsici]|uniref:serine/threonine-protein kinase n=1 Tax=Lysobacter capsici TaxID=435897 RepID=UPI00177B0263|nr:serine/threonine-protein kinase [Lysobacter capsici]UOF16511.1 protein kinase [Lysobacter capsici]
MSEPTATGIYTQHSLKPGAMLAGRFRIEALIGVGGMGVVYRARDTALDVDVALKLLRPELAARGDAFERFRQELLTARQVSSPRVVRIHDLIRHEQQWLIGMDLIDGEALDKRLDRDGALPIDDAIAIARQIAEGLAAAHARGVIHRDLKPANVLIDRAGDAYISDFGVARSLAGSGLTQTGAIVGTPDYLSPEQARGEPSDGRSDLYALGLILHEMLTGKMPFDGGTISEILAQRMLRTPPPVSRLRADTPVWLVRLVDRLLRSQPAHRLQSAQAVMQAIDTRHVARDWRPGKTLWIGAASAALLAALGMGAWLWRSPAPSPATPASLSAASLAATLHRIVVSPLQAPAGAVDAEQARAFTALLREALSTLPGLAVVDDERSQQAIRQLDPSGAAPPSAADLARIARADRIVSLQLSRHEGQWRMQARLHDGAAAPRIVATGDGATALRAFTALIASQRLSDLPGVQTSTATATPLPLPSSDAALQAYGAGLLARQNSDIAAAIAGFTAATAQAPDFISAWLALADANQAAGDIDAAYAALENSQRPGKGNAPMQAYVSAQRAQLDGDAEAATNYWRQRLRATPDDTYAALGLARALGAGGDPAAAIAQARTLSERDPDDPRAWFERGKFSILHGQAQQAVDDYLVRALVLYKRSGNRYGEGETVNALGIGYARLGQNDHAQAQYRQAVELRRAVGNRRGLATSLRNLGNVLVLTGQFDEAQRSLQQARELHAALDDRHGLAAVENELGLLAEERGDYPGALAAFRRALSAWQQAGDAGGTAQALNDIGFAHYQLGAYDDAEAYLQQSQAAYAKLDDETGRIRTAQNLGQLAAARGQWPLARERLQSSLRDALAKQMMEEAAVSRRNLAELELMQGHLGAALEQVAQADALFRQRSDARGQVDVGLLRTQALLRADADDQARKSLAELTAQIAAASSEQRGIAALLQAELARRANDRDGARRALTEAQRDAQASGVRLLQLQVALQAAGDGRLPAAVEAQIAALGHAGLRLQWTQARMREALARHDPTAALRIYRDIQPVLRRGDNLEAAALHTLAVSAAHAAGDKALAATAENDAATARQRLREQLPPALRAGAERAALAQTAPHASPQAEPATAPRP